MNVFQTARTVPTAEAAQRLGLRMRRSGDRFTARCPYHEDKTPSFVMYPGDRGFYCFSCHRSGDATTLYQHMKQLTPLEAARTVCRDFGLTWDENRRPAPPSAPPVKRTDEAYLNALKERHDAARRTMDAMGSQRAEDDLMDDPLWLSALCEQSRLMDEMLNLDGAEHLRQRHYPKGDK